MLSPRTLICAGQPTLARLRHLSVACSIVRAMGTLSATTPLAGGRTHAILATFGVGMGPVDVAFPARLAAAIITKKNGGTRLNRVRDPAKPRLGHHFAARRAIPAGLRHPDWPCDVVRAVATLYTTTRLMGGHSPRRYSRT